MVLSSLLQIWHLICGVAPGLFSILRYNYYCSPAPVLQDYFSNTTGIFHHCGHCSRFIFPTGLHCILTNSILAHFVFPWHFCNFDAQPLFMVPTRTSAVCTITCGSTALLWFQLSPLSCSVLPSFNATTLLQFSSIDFVLRHTHHYSWHLLQDDFSNRISHHCVSTAIQCLVHAVQQGLIIINFNWSVRFCQFYFQCSHSQCHC